MYLIKEIILALTDDLQYSCTVPGHRTVGIGYLTFVLLAIVTGSFRYRVGEGYAPVNALLDLSFVYPPQ